MTLERPRPGLDYQISHFRKQFPRIAEAVGAESSDAILQLVHAGDSGRLTRFVPVYVPGARLSQYVSRFGVYHLPVGSKGVIYLGRDFDSALVVKCFPPNAGHNIGAMNIHTGTDLTTSEEVVNGLKRIVDAKLYGGLTHSLNSKNGKGEIKEHGLLYAYGFKI